MTQAGPVKHYFKIRSIEKKEIVRENADGKREKKIVHVLKGGEIGGITIRLNAEEPFKFPVGSVVAASFEITQKTLDESATKLEDDDDD